MRYLAKGKFSRARGMHFSSKEALEQTTPEEVARYRAERLKGKVAVDLCCGMGMDAIALAKNCGKVIAVDRDGEAVRCAKVNAEAYGIKNMEFVCADFSSLDLKALGADVVFADPERRVNGKRVKGLSETVPGTLALIRFAQEAGVKNLCVEVSSKLPLEELPAECEAECLSIEHEVHCMSLYFGEARQGRVSAVLLPGKERISTEKIPEPWNGKEGKLGKYFFELDEGIVLMRLQPVLLEELGKREGSLSAYNEKYFTAEKEVHSPFFKNNFEVLAVLEKGEDLERKLKGLNAGKIVLRAKMDPQEHVKRKRELEQGLTGSQKLHVFQLESCTVLCRNTAFY